MTPSSESSMRSEQSSHEQSLDLAVATIKDLQAHVVKCNDKVFRLTEKNRKLSEKHRRRKAKDKQRKVRLAAWLLRCRSIPSAKVLLPSHPRSLFHSQAREAAELIEVSRQHAHSADSRGPSTPGIFKSTSLPTSLDKEQLQHQEAATPALLKKRSATPTPLKVLQTAATKATTLRAFLTSPAGRRSVEKRPGGRLSDSSDEGDER